MVDFNEMMADLGTKADESHDKRTTLLLLAKNSLEDKELMLEWAKYFFDNQDEKYWQIEENLKKFTERFVQEVVIYINYFSSSEENKRIPEKQKENIRIWRDYRLFFDNPDKAPWQINLWKQVESTKGGIFRIIWLKN